MKQDTNITDNQRRLIEENYGVAIRVGRQMQKRLPDNFKDECEGVALEGLVKAAMTFDARRGVPFRAYATVSMRRFIIDTCRKENPDYHREGNKQRRHVSLAALHKSAAPEITVDPETVTRQLEHLFTEKLDKREKRIWKKRLEGQTFQRIGRRERLTTTRIHQIWTGMEGRIRKNLRRQGINSYEDLLPSFS